jgi:hypothetical protein
MRREPPPELDGFLSPFDETLAETVLRLRDRILSVMPNAHEIVWDAVNAVSITFTPTTRWQDGICNIATYSRHANLGFSEGASHPDPLGVLEGTGSHKRHVSFRSADDASTAKAPWIEDYVRIAMTSAGMKPDEGDRGTTFRIMTGTKRRPS